MHSPGPSTVLFDLDNTLVPFLPSLRAWASAWAKPLVPPAKRQALADDLVEHTLSGGEDPARGIATVTARWNLHLPDERLEAAAEHARRVYRGTLSPYPGIRRVLDTLSTRGVALAIVTDAPRAQAEERLEATGLAPWFETVVTRDDSPRGKQGPEPFRTALRALEAQPETTAMVGDWPTYDVRWPKRLGMRTVLAGWGCQRHEHPKDPDERPWAVADRPEDLPRLLVTRDPGPLPAAWRPNHTLPLTAFTA